MKLVLNSIKNALVSISHKILKSHDMEKDRRRAFLCPDSTTRKREPGAKVPRNTNRAQELVGIDSIAERITLRRSK